MKRFFEQPIRHGQSPILRILVLGVLGGAVVGATYPANPANAQIFQDDGLAQSSSRSNTSYYDSLYAGYEGYSTEGGYGAEGVPEPATFAGLALAGMGLAYLHRCRQRQHA
ncbi:PEP-CTERM sorting domain-containing protein [Trichothermofontia sp.]